MKILFFMRSTVYVRNFESTLRLLADRGHQVHVVADPNGTELIDRLCREHPQIRYSQPPALPFNRWTHLGTEVRRAIDFLRYLGPEYGYAPKLRLRAERKAPEFVVAALRKPLVGSPAGRWLLAHVLHWIDRAVPRDPALDAFIGDEKPDLVLVTPLVEPGSPQADYLRSARALGIRTGLCVYSWDNLTNKGLIHDPLDLVTVWNEAMRDEAVSLHGVPPERVVVTGAVPYDHWFTWQPRTARDAFRARVGLPADRPYLLYLCSSKFIAPNEVDFVRRWVTEVRAASAELRDVGVLIRPHPQNTEQWEQADLGDLPGVAVWPRGGGNPVDEESRADYFDSIYHSAAVVGVNTSAQIESAIVGRAVYTVLAPEFRETQEGTLHFRHLRDVNGGLLHVAATFPEHVSQLVAALRGEHGDDDRCRRFVEAFVRPYGLDVAAAPRLLGALEATAAQGAARTDRGPWWAPLVRPALAPVANRLARTVRARKVKTTSQQRLKLQRHADLAERRAALAAAKRSAAAEGALRKEQERARAEAERRAAAATAAKAYQDYLHVRDWARQMRVASNGAVSLTPAEQQTIGGLAPLWDAAPETIATLRQRAELVGGARRSDYDDPESGLMLRLRRDLHVLRRQIGRDLFVQEPGVLGGFGYVRGGERFNEDTVTYFQVLAALQDAAVLGEYRATAGRRLVWEVGGGWGGFAYQFKTVCPNVTYLITGIPDLFLLSAVYLMSAFPASTFRFYDAASPDAFWRNWEHADFMFAPESALRELSAPPVDLALDVMALHDMNASRVCNHVQRAFDFGARYFYSLLPLGPATEKAAMIRRAIERLYWPHPVPPRTESDSATVGAAAATEATERAHLVGWRRMRV